ncbi:MAG: triose-phosphate isomerase [Candidatus Vogelbacteria bacterium]|nr:triose-phosphate isomerase [Candidatus Vogelbacteria bacterium]
MKKLIVANWKLNPESLREAKEILAPVKRAAARFGKVETVICPPAVFLLAQGQLKKPQGLSLGGQDAFWEPTGAFTGQISAVMLRKAGAKYVILGHSERRAFGDSDEVINWKVKAALRAGLKIILCVGETARDHEGHYLKVIKHQLEQNLKQISRGYFQDIIIAYEPVWAIGAAAKSSDTPDAFHQQSIYIRKVLSAMAGKEQAMRTSILYGGSVNVKNAEAFLREGAADGLLVGRASLRPDHFIQILKIANAVA